MWYESTPTVWSHGGEVDFINHSYDDVEKKFKDKDTKEKTKIKDWVNKCKADGTHPRYATREFAVAQVAAVPAAATGLKAETTSVTKDADKELLIDVTEYEKIVSAVAESKVE